MVLTKVH